MFLKSIEADSTVSMEKLNKEIEDMYRELVADGEADIQKTFDFSTIRDNFRQHIHTRRNSEASDLVLLDGQMVQNLIRLKQKSFELLQNFRNANRSTKELTKGRTFSSFEEFVNFTVNQEEILNSELWKLEAICNYLDQLQLDSSSASAHESQGV